jgi:uncharacterized membrane protein
MDRTLDDRSSPGRPRATIVGMSNSSAGATAPVPGAHPGVAAFLEERAASIQNRIADAITSFAGSMLFVYAHIVIFGAWMAFVEKNPWPTLTLVVSLEAIFLSTFVMIGQNRQAGFAEAKANHDFREQELELKSNTDLTRDIHRLTTELHRRVVGDAQPQQ